VEAVFRPEVFPMILASSCGKAQGIGWNPPEKSKKFPVGILLPLPAISGAFLQDPVGITFDLGRYKQHRITW